MSTVMVGSLFSLCFKVDPKKAETNQKFIVKWLRKAKADDPDDSENKKVV